MILIIALSTILIVTYGCLILWSYHGLKAMDTDVPQKEIDDPKPKLSVIVPFRNEADHLKNLLSDLQVQDYLKNSLEIILIDDHSQDKGQVIIREFKRTTHLNLNLLQLESTYGKKEALKVGWQNAQGDIIVQTDADCRLPENWLNRLVKAFTDRTIMALAPVKMCPTKGFWSKFAALEYLSLQAVGAGMARTGKVFMGSAANMAYRSELVRRVDSHLNRLSGDDVFLIQEARAKGEVGFLLDENVIVATEAPSSFWEFITQRARWGGKTTSYSSGSAWILALLVAFVSLWQVGLLILSVFHAAAIYAFIGLFLIKGFVDYLLLRLFARKTAQSDLMRLFPFAALIYPFYILITGLVILFGRINWKERSFRPIVD